MTYRPIFLVLAPVAITAFAALAMVIGWQIGMATPERVIRFTMGAFFGSVAMSLLVSFGVIDAKDDP